MAVELPIFDGGVYKIQFGCYWADQAAINTIYVFIANTMGNPTTALLAEGFDDLVHAAYKSIMTNSATYYGVKAQRQLATGNPEMGYVTADNEGAGTDGTAPLPGQVTGVITFQTVFTGPKYRGRIYLPFPDEESNDADANGPDAGYLLAADTLADLLSQDNSLTNGVDTIDTQTVVYHREDHTWTNIEGWFVPPKWGTQRRRGAYGAKNAYPPLS